MAEAGYSQDFVRKDIAPKPERVRKAPLDAVVVCGMGPLKLDENIRGSKERFPANPHNRLNANAAKVLATHGLVDTVIVSGKKTAQTPDTREDEFAMKERDTSEAKLLEDTYNRMGGKGITAEAKEQAKTMIELDQEAGTTFANIILGLNALDARSGGYWEGEFGVLSAEFHSPRIAEMIKAFGLKNARALSAERILDHFGYKGRKRLVEDENGNRIEKFDLGDSYEQTNVNAYAGQPAGLENLQDNPGYVTFELKQVASDRRLQEMAGSLKAYYQDKGIALPAGYDLIPDSYDTDFDYESLRTELGKIKTDKHKYTGTITPDDYRILAAKEAEKTNTFLQEVAPLPSTSREQTPLQE